MPSGLRRTLRVLAALAVASCGGDGSPAAGPGQASDLSLEGAKQLPGASVDDWSLLAVPRGGGRATARSARDPSEVVWQGETQLPPVREIHLLEGPLLVLRGRDGEVHRYDPQADELVRIGAVGEDAEWHAGGRYGVFADPGGELLEVGPEGSWRYRVSATPVWASPVSEGGVAALVETPDGGTSLWVIRRGQSEPEARSQDGYSTPALATAWGTRLALADPGDEAGLTFVTVPELARSTQVPVSGPVAALAASPSTHEVYVGTSDPPAVMGVNRFTGEAQELARLPAPPREIRPAVLGAFLLVDDGRGGTWVPLSAADGAESVRLQAEWRSDLPLGLPDGRVLLARDGQILAWEPGGGGEPVAAPAGLWWGAVPWNPAPPAVTADRLEGETVEPGFPDTAAPGGEEAPPDRAQPTVAPPAPADTPPPEPGRDTVPAVASGFYAVVVAAQDEGGVRRLLDDLSAAGYPTALQRHTDDAGQLWYRGMVGPYDSRQEVDAAARQLRRERGLDMWITEVRAGRTTEEIIR